MAPLPLEECQALMLAPGAPKVDKVGRSRTLRICSCGRPWFRAFHFSWMSFFLSFLGWFAFAPVLNYLAEDPSIMATPSEIANSNIISVLGTILVRLVLGPLCEKYGSRKLMTLVLVYGSICVALSSLVNSVAGLYTARFFISFVGGAFIMCQYWTTVMFSKEVVGTANATAGGWGNLGGGVSALLVGGLLDAFGPQGANYPDNLAWRYAMLVPAALMFMITIPMYVLTDDCPYGDWSNKQYNGHTSHDSEAGSAGFDPSDVENSAHNGNMTSIPETSMHAPVPKPKTDKELEEMAQSDINKAIQMGKTTETDIKKAKVEGENVPEEKGRWLPLGFDDWRVWVLAIQYGLCFGVEVAITNFIPIYLYNGFKKDGCVEDPKTAVLECAYYNKSMAALVGSLFGMTNIFARASGGYMSDKLFAKIGMRGRLITLFVVNIFQGIFVIVFSQLHDPQAATAILVIFAMFVQMGAGATYGIVPFVNSKAVGPVSGVVGAGGNIGAVTWTAMFKAAPNMRTGFLWLGIVVICGTFTLLPVPVKGVTLLCGGKEEKYDDDAISSNKADPIKGYAVAEPSNHTKQPPLADPSAPSEVNNKVANV